MVCALTRSDSPPDLAVRSANRPMKSGVGPVRLGAESVWKWDLGF